MAFTKVLTDDKLDIIERLYVEDCESVRGIGRILNMSYGTVYRGLFLRNVQMRSRNPGDS